MASRPTASVSQSNPTAVPTHDSELRERIARRAYELFQRRGYSHGRDQDDWLEAERQLLSERQRVASAVASVKAKPPRSPRVARAEGRTDRRPQP